LANRDKTADVRQEAAERTLTLDDDDPQFIARLIDFLYSADYADNHGFETSIMGDDDFVEPWKVHVEMYALAEKYDIAGLKEVSAKKFKACFVKMTVFDDPKLGTLSDIVSAIYDSTPNNFANRHLREYIAKQTKLRMVILHMKTEFKDIVDCHRDYSWDILTAPATS
jgi:hypothetical protein